MIRLILNTQMKSAFSQLALLLPIRSFFPYPLFFPPTTHIALIPILCKYKKIPTKLVISIVNKSKTKARCCKSTLLVQLLANYSKL